MLLIESFGARVVSGSDIVLCMWERVCGWLDGIGEGGWTYVCNKSIGMKRDESKGIMCMCVAERKSRHAWS